MVVKKVTYTCLSTIFRAIGNSYQKKEKKRKRNIRETSYINLIVIKTILKSLRMKNWLSHVRPIKLSPSNGIVYDMRHRTLMSCQNKSGSLEKRMLWLDILSKVHLLWQFSIFMGKIKTIPMSLIFFSLSTQWIMLPHPTLPKLCVLPGKKVYKNVVWCIRKKPYRAHKTRRIKCRVWETRRRSRRTHLFKVVKRHKRGSHPTIIRTIYMSTILEDDIKNFVCMCNSLKKWSCGWCSHASS